MNVTVRGGTGFIGRHLVESLRAAGHNISVLGRGDLGVDTRADALVNLAGEPIAQRWTSAAKQRIRDSRVAGTRRLVHALSQLSKRSAVLVSASAIGYYGSRGDEVLTEESAAGQGFLAELCTEWEKEAGAAEALGIRVVRVRIGIVLGKDGGALAKMLPPFKMRVGGKLGSGEQWMSWIHVEDLAGLIRFVIEEPRVKGPVNGTAPNPVTNAEFTRTLARVLHRPAFMTVPAFALKALFGEMSHVLLDSQRVLPRAGYVFQYPELRAAFEQIFAG